MNCPQPVGAVHRDLLLDEYRDGVADLGGQLLDLGQAHPTLTPAHPGALSAGAHHPTGETR